MNPQQAENLRILIRHMETKVTRTLHMAAISRDCGTPACALGEAGAIGIAGLSLPKYESTSTLILNGATAPMTAVADVVFGLMPFSWSEAKQAHRLFCAATDNAWRRNEVTPQEWATEARRVLAENGYAMDAAPTSDGFAAFMDRVRAPVAVEA